jgi:hypothetical protein
MMPVIDRVAPQEVSSLPTTGNEEKATGSDTREESVGSASRDKPPRKNCGACPGPEAAIAEANESYDPHESVGV